MKTGAKIFTYSLGLAVIICGAGVVSANPNLAQPSSIEVTDKEMARKEQELQDKLNKANNPENSGKVVETMDAGSYTYALLDKEGKKNWVAMPVMKVAIGQELFFYGCSEMWNFKSRSLDRTFDRILFCNQPEKKIGGESDGGMAGKASVGSAGVIAPPETIKVEQATGKDAYNIENLYSSKETLDNKKVVVKGKVIKVSEGIMGKNWIHVQDGSGDAKKMTNNLVVTTQDLPKVGDTVVINGTLKADKDFGGGYKYDVIVEEAAIK